MRTIALLLVIAAFTATASNAVAGQFKKPVYYKAGLLNWSVVSADFNRDGNLDLAVGDYESSLVYLFLGKGNGAFHAATTFFVPAPLAMAVGDFNGDHLPDLAVLEYPGTLGIYLNNGDGTFSNSANYALGESPGRLVVADFDHDGHADIATTAANSEQDGEVEVFFGHGDGTFGEPAIYPVTGAPGGIAAGDLNGDHHPDLVVTEFLAGAVAILMNDGHGNFTLTATYSTPSCGEPIGPAIADFAHNGGAGLAIGCVQGITVFPSNGDGTFGNPTLYSTEGIGRDVRDIAVADFNQDGKLDMAASLWNGDAALLYGKGDGTFQHAVPIKFKKGERGSTARTMGDFNKDGAPDLVVASADLIVLLNAG